MCERVVAICKYELWYVPDQYTTQEMCDRAVLAEPYVIKSDQMI